MTKKIKLFVACFSFALILGTTGCALTRTSDKDPNNIIVAKVYNEKLTLSEVDSNLGNVLTQLETNYGKDFKSNDVAKNLLAQKRFSYINTRVNDIIFKTKATEYNIMPTEDELTAKSIEQLNIIKASFESEKEFNTTLASTGFTEAQLLDELKMTAVSEILYKHITDDVKPTENEIKNYYEENINTFTEQPNAVYPAHILVEDLEVAEEIISKLHAGENFSDLAKEYGTDDTKNTGGALSWVQSNSNTYDKNLITAALELKKGEYTKEPVKTTAGYHVLFCLDKKEYPTLPLDAVKSKIELTLIDQQKFSTWTDTVKEWQSEAKLKLYEDTLTK